MPSPIPPRLLPRDLYPCADVGVCSSPLSHGSTLQVPRLRHTPGRLWSSVIHWKQLRSVEPVGAGGFGSVYRADYRSQTVALKRVKKCTKNPLASRHSFWAELNAAHLQHANIVRVLAATTCVPPEFEDGGSFGTILMEFVGDRNLQQVIYGPEPLEGNTWLRYATDIASGLAYLHRHRIVHLDIKPANVLLSPDDVCKIADFGCSIQLGADSDTSMSAHHSHTCGTYTHRAPELLRGEVASPKADIFSFGITLWQLLTREPPYSGDRQHVIYAVVAHSLRPSLQEHAVFRSEWGRDLSALLGHCWSSDSPCRPTATHLLRLLRTWASNAPQTT
ncbi:proto-oncogene serine/threonine-protein kinase mos [Xenentodon cancila]